MRRVEHVYMTPTSPSNARSLRCLNYTY